MNEPNVIRFDDGAAYEEFMGKWSRLAGRAFLDWLAPAAGLRWVDVGCGNGAFTDLIVARCGPLDVQGIDPSDAQVVFARDRLRGAPVAFRTGDAMALPYADATFDAATMALVIFFVPDPTRGVAEMARVVRPGGSISAYAWDILGGWFPFAAVQQEMAALGHPPMMPPSVEVSRIDALHALWRDAGLVRVDTRVIEVERTFPDFEAFWSIAKTGPVMKPRLAAMATEEVERLTARLRERLPAAADGSITYAARANAVRGEVPA